MVIVGCPSTKEDGAWSIARFHPQSVSNPRTSSTREGRKMQDNTLGEPISRKNDHGKGQDSGRKLPIKGIPFPTALNALQQPYQSVALMRKWHLNSSFTASNLFYHLQQNSDGTSDLRKVLRHTSEGLGSKEEEYIREGNLPVKGGIIL